VTPRSTDAADSPNAAGWDTATIGWTVVSDSAGRAVLDAYCAGVGPAIIQPAVARVHEDAPSGDGTGPLTIVSWNMALGAGDLRRLTVELRAGRHTAGRPVRDFVLLLQQVPRGGQHVPPASALDAGAAVSAPDPIHGPDVTALARELGLHLLYVPSMRNGRDDPAVDEGNAVMATAPLTGARALELPAGIRRRVAAAAVVAWSGEPGAGIGVVSAHLDNFAWRRLAGSFGATRAGQARALAAVLPPNPVLVLGADLNTWTRGPRETAFRVLRAALPRPRELPPGATARRVGVPRRLDYLMLRAPPSWRVEVHRIDDRYGSDHHPIIGELHPPERAAAAEMHAYCTHGCRLVHTKER
jgi:endonuclease/exonuclease/phosphatase family metal-dependent hydrolase